MLKEGEPIRSSVDQILRGQRIVEKVFYIDPHYVALPPLTYAIAHG